ncbi:MAG: hypothetical protein V4508_09910 [Pseudomonadota bacterium]
MATAKDNPHGGRTDAGVDGSTLTSLVKFLIGNWQKLPPWPRTVSYFIVLLLIVYVVLSQYAGSYALRGSIAQQKDSNDYVYIDATVEVGGQFYGTNREGVFHVILSAAELLQATTGEGLPIKLIFRDGSRQRVTRKASFLYKIFDEIVLDVNNRVVVAPTSPASARFSLISSAFAQAGGTASSENDRLFVEKIKTPSNWQDRSVQLNIVRENETVAPVNTYANSTAKSLPAMSGRALNTGQNYYFSLPKKSNDSVGLELRGLDKSISFLQNKADGNLRVDTLAYGATRNVELSDGAAVNVTRYSPYDAILFVPKFNEKYATAEIVRQLRALGIRPLIAPSPTDQPANALLAGTGTSYIAIQNTITALVRSGVHFKGVQCNLNSVADNQIQFGYLAKYQHKEELSESQLLSLLNARNSTDFAKNCNTQ